MYVCLCHAVKEAEIVAAVAGGCKDLDVLGEVLGVGTSCEICRSEAQSILDTVLHNASQPENACKQELVSKTQAPPLQQAINF